MAKRNQGDPGNLAKDPRGPGADRALWVVPRRWLILLVALMVLPWLIAAAFYSRTASGSEVRETPGVADAPSARRGDSRPWGTLETTQIVISPPIEYVPSNWGPIQAPRWYVGGTRDELGQFLTMAGLAPQQVAGILSTARAEAGGLVVTPDPGFVRDLDPEVRANIYTLLAKNALNDRQRNAYRLFGAPTQAWLEGAPISPHTRQLVERLVYRVGDFAYFSDIDLVRSEIKDPAELQWLAKRLLRDVTLLVRLRLENASQVEAAAEYWGRGGRRTDIRPLLESVVASADRTIDVGHLLPPLAREHLYRYPRISLGDLEKPSLVNCFWTALNFFNERPDDRYLDSTFALDRLKRDYYIVHDNLQFGDIAAFPDPSGNYFHAAVYLADGLVFGKNGASHLAPWTIVPIERLRGYYLEHADEWRVDYYRRKDF